MDICISCVDRDAELLDFVCQRKCSKCIKIKAHSDFKKDRKRRFGIQRICKDCDNVIWPKYERKRIERKAKDAERQKKIDAGFSDIVDPIHSADYHMQRLKLLLDTSSPVNISELSDSDVDTQYKNRFLEKLTTLPTVAAVTLVDGNCNRKKMGRDGFCQRIIDGAVRLLPSILKFKVFGSRIPHPLVGGDECDLVATKITFTCWLMFSARTADRITDESN